MPDTPAYRRILLKLSGEALMGDRDFGYDFSVVNRFADDIKSVSELGVQISVVAVSFKKKRGNMAKEAGLERAGADYMGMLATVINALALQNVLEKKGLETRVQSAIPIASVCESYIRRRAIRHMEKGRIVIFAAGTGNPFFTTDTAAALRAVEMGCDALLKGTQVDGVYSADPKKDPSAERFEALTYREVLTRDLKVMDAAAIVLARDNKVPILVFSLQNPGGLGDVVRGDGKFTEIC
ncbi:MAG: UMP kinase [Rhodospirillales bacterium]|nr:UMP kinase [Rhodospirillales bacterium]